MVTPSPSTTASLQRNPKRRNPNATAAASVYSHHIAETHPLGVRPLGNLLFDAATPGRQSSRSSGLGAFAALDDHFLLELIAGHAFSPTLNPDSPNSNNDDALACDRALARLAQTSRAWYCFAYDESVWRSRTIARFRGNFRFQHSWRNTFKACFINAARSSNELIIDSPIRMPGIYSDVLFTSFRCASVPLADLCGIHRNSIDRRNNLSLQNFISEYATPNRPVVITDIVPKWPAYHKWSLEYLDKHYGNQVFRAESVDITFTDYLSYMRQAHEESPLYLFDKKFADCDTGLSQDYSVPVYFDEDLFRVLGKDRRPDYRWLIVGPARSGSTFHVDPNSTCAWNAVITGAKKWILFPPECIPPGVYPSADGSEVTSPVSLVEWYMNYYNEIHKHPSPNTPHTASTPPKPIETVCRAGELLYVPHGWWHCVINLEDSIAITQNYVSTPNCADVLDFLEFRRDQVSGYCHGDLYTEFVSALRDVDNDTLKCVQDVRCRKILGVDMDAGVNKKSVDSSSSSLWTKLTGNAVAPQHGSITNDHTSDQSGYGHLDRDDAPSTGFSFSFGGL